MNCLEGFSFVKHFNYARHHSTVIHHAMKFTQPFIFSTLMLSLVGCQSMLTPTAPTTPSKPKTPSTEKSPSAASTVPYERPEIKRQPYAVQVPQQAAPLQRFEDGQQLPAFNRLIQQTQQALQQGQLGQAEQYALQAQRLAPQSAQSFLYLAQIAQAKNQPSNAEALARRGLSFAQTSAIQKQLWQVILKSGQQQKQSQTIREAQAQLQRFS